MDSPLDESPAARNDAASDEDDVVRNGGANDSLDDDDEIAGGDDLFGDEDDDVPTKKKRRHIDDEDLDSGDDEDREDRAQGEDEQPQTHQREFTVAELDLTRSAIPRPSDGELYLLKVPDFLEIDPKAFTLASFKPPTTDHHSKKGPSATFSAYGTAMTTMRWRRSPSNPAELQSNARVLRWSDGSLTLQLASDPTSQYELPANPLAPPQINPSKPTPTSIRDRRNKNARTTYTAAKDSFTYLATPHPDHAVMRFTNKITAGLSVLATTASNGGMDEALERLQDSLIAAQRAKEAAAEGGMLVSHEDSFEDPELAKKRAEAAEREKLRAQRKLEAQVSRERDRASRALGRPGVRVGGGLTVGGLEGEDGGGRYASGRPSKPKARRRILRDEYSDEDDYAGRRTTKEDEYDMDDEFMAASDEDVEAEEDEEDIDDILEAQERQRERDRDRRGSSPKRRVDDDDDDEEVGEASSPKVAKRRRVIDDDEDDE